MKASKRGFAKLEDGDAVPAPLTAKRATHTTANEASAAASAPKQARKRNQTVAAAYATIRLLLPYFWPKQRFWLRFRLIVAMLLLIGSRLVSGNEISFFKQNKKKKFVH